MAPSTCSEGFPSGTHTVPQASALITSDPSLPAAVRGSSQVQGFFLVLLPVPGAGDTGGLHVLKGSMSNLE